MAALAVDNVHVEGPEGVVVFSHGDEVPEWAARKMGPHCFEDGVHPYAEVKVEDVSGPPAKAGPNSSKDAWAAYAESVGVDVSGCGTRDEMIAAIDAAGQPTE